MDRIVRFLVLLFMAFVGRTAFRSFLIGAPGDGGRGAGASSGGFAQTQVAPLLEKVSGGHIAAEQMGLVAAGTMVYALVLGYFARAAFGDRLFGPRISGLIALGGSWLALLFYAGLIGQGSPDATEWAIGLAIFGSFAALGLAAILKAFVAGEFNALMSGGPTRTAMVTQRINAIAQPRGPSADRLRSAVSRPQR